MRTIIENRGNIEALKKKAKRNKIIHILSILMFPVVIFSLIGVAIKNEGNGTVSDNLLPIFYFMLISRVLLLLIFFSSGVLLLRSLMKYSRQIYKFSKFKVTAIVHIDSSVYRLWSPSSWAR